MLHASTQNLIVKLCELTALGDIQWREGAAGAVLFETEGYAVEVTGQPAKLRVLNLDGAELEHVDADALAAPWPDGEGSFADHISTMATQAHRLARGTDHAISRILSSLSAPPTAAPVAESDAAPAADAPPATTATAPAEPAVEPETPAAPDPQPRAEPVAAEHVKRSTETFGRTRSFAIAGRTHHRSSPEARPVSSLGKITASGLVVPVAPSANRQPVIAEPMEHQVDHQAAEPAPTEPTPPAPEAVSASAPRPVAAPASPDAYKPWV